MTVEAAKKSREDVIWIEEMLPKPDLIQILSHATVFVCPSVCPEAGVSPTNYVFTFPPFGVLSGTASLP